MQSTSQRLASAVRRIAARSQETASERTLARLLSTKYPDDDALDGGAAVNKQSAADRRQSGAQASTSSPDERSGRSSQRGATERSRIMSIAHLRPAAAKVLGINQDGTVQRNTWPREEEKFSQRAPTSTLDAKKAYRQDRARMMVERQQKVAAAQAAVSATLAAKQEVRRDAKATAQAAAEAPREALMAKKSLSDKLEKSDCAKYVTFDQRLLPEVFATDVPRGEELHPRGGCQGLKEELEATSSEVIMLRESMLELLDTVQSKARRQLYLTGAPSSGKSIALAALVAALRARGWLVMYVPQAKQLTHGGFFSRADGTMWDTPEIAKLVMHYTLAAHPERARAVLSPASGRTLEEVIQAGLSETEASAVVDAFLEAKQTVAAADDAMIAVDNYQALYMPSEYGEWMNNHHRRIIQPDELRVASALRLLEQPPLRDGVVVCAADRGGSSSGKLRMPMASSCLFNVPRMNKQEWRAMADYYNIQAIIDEMAPAAVERAFFLTAGNPREYRRIADIFNMCPGPEAIAA